MPSIGTLALIQPCRGLLFIGVGLVIVTWTATRRWQTALAVAATLSILGGMAPLLGPNPYLPTPVRLVHLVEVGVSNFFFGLLVGWLFAPPAPSVEAHARKAVAA